METGGSMLYSQGPSYNPYPEPNQPNSNAACHQLTLLTDGENSRMRMKVQGRLFGDCLTLWYRRKIRREH